MSTAYGSSFLHSHFLDDHGWEIFFTSSYPIGSICRHIYLHLVVFFYGFHVRKYASPMDPMGTWFLHEFLQVLPMSQNGTRVSQPALPGQCH